MRKLGLILALAGSVAAAGCTNMSREEQGTLSGAAIGAVGGAAIAGIAGGNMGVGALVGGAGGAIAGNILSKN